MKPHLLLSTLFVSMSCAQPSEPRHEADSGVPCSACSADAGDRVTTAATSPSSELETRGSLTTHESSAEHDAGRSATQSAPHPTDSGVDAATSSVVSSPDSGPASSGDAGGTKRYERPRLVVSAMGQYWSEQELVSSSSAQADVVVNESVSRQEWLGFSGGLNEAGWEALTVLSEQDRTAAIELLFGSAGLHLNLAQIPIGAGESALQRYFPHDVEGDFAMEHFTIERDEVNLIPYIEAARTANPQLGFWAVPWSPPPWMKTNLSPDGGSIRNEPEVLQAYALYLSKFIEAYGAKGIPVDALHLQAEADADANYPSCVWEGNALRDFTKLYLLPTLDARGLEPRIWAGDFIEGSQPVVERWLRDPDLGPRLSGIGLAWGMLSAVEAVADATDLPIFQTQHNHGNAPYPKETFRDVPPNDHAYAVESWELLVRWLQQSSAYNFGNLVLDTMGWNLDSERPWPQNALLVVDRETKSLRVTPTYYVVRHLSQFLDPGAVRLDTLGHDALVFRNPDASIVVVLHNRDSAPVGTALQVREQVYDLEIPGEGWVTLFVE